MIEAGFIIPVERKPDGLSPDSWKHNVRVALEYPGRYCVPHEGEHRMNMETLLVYLAKMAGSPTLQDALDALTAKGPGSESTRLNMADSFNDVAGYQPYSD